MAIKIVVQNRIIPSTDYRPTGAMRLSSSPLTTIEELREKSPTSVVALKTLSDTNAVALTSLPIFKRQFSSQSGSIPASSIFGDGSLIQVSVSVPAKLPTSGPVYFDVSVSSVKTGARPTVERRFNAFDGLANKLRWDSIAVGAPDLPPKTPWWQLGSANRLNATQLTERAAGLQLWSSFVLQQPEALKHPDVCVFFGLPPKRISLEELAQAEEALLKLQAIGRGFLARGETSEATARRKLAGAPSIRRALLFTLMLLPLGLLAACAAAPDATCCVPAILTAAVGLPAILSAAKPPMTAIAPKTAPAPSKKWAWKWGQKKEKRGTTGQ